MMPPNVQAAKYCGEKSSIFPLLGIIEDIFDFSPDEAIVSDISMQFVTLDVSVAG